MRLPVRAVAFLFPLVVARPAGAEEKISAEARSHFEAGVALLQDPDGARYEEAYREFVAAYDESRSARVLGNVGLCAMKLERDAEAIDAYTRYVDEVADIDPVERDQIRRDLATLKAGLVKITLTVSPRGARVVDVRLPVRGEPVSNGYPVTGDRVTLGVRAGHHVLRARIGDRESAPLEIDAAPGAVYERALVVLPPPANVVVTKPAPSRGVPIAMLGTGLAVLAAGGVTAYLSMRKVDDIGKQCPAGECPADYDLESAQRKARTFTTLTDGLLIGGGILTLGGLTWLMLLPSSKERTRASAMCTGTGCFGSIGGSF